MKQAINTKTQEEYDALMSHYESKGMRWSGGQLPTMFDNWSRFKDNTWIIPEYFQDNVLEYGSTEEVKRTEGISILIPYTEFAKANIVEEVDWKTKYEEAVKLLEWSKQICANIQRTKTYGTKFPETATLGVAIDEFLNPR